MGCRWAPVTGQGVLTVTMKCQRRSEGLEGQPGDTDLSDSSSSMSDYGSDQEDVELELSRDRTRPHVVISEAEAPHKNILHK